MNKVIVMNITYTAEKKFTQEQVQPEYHGRGIAGNMIEMVKEKYKNYLYIEVMPEERKNASFYEKHGFQIMQDGVAMQMCNFLDRR